jgi:drug/metabolite transporter (DMT)-like permease
MAMTLDSQPEAGHLPRRARAVSLLGILAVSTASVFIRLAQASGGPSLLIAAGRMLVAALVILPAALWLDREHLRRVTRRDAGLAILSGVFLAAHFAFWITSLELTSVASSVVLVTTTPLWVSLVSTLFLREPPKGGTLLGMLAALTGTGVVALSEVCTLAGGLKCAPAVLALSGLAVRGDGLALLGAWMVSGYFLIGRSLRPRMSLRVYALLTYGTAGIVLLGALLVIGVPLAPYPLEVYAWIAALGLVPQLIGHSAFNWALRYLSATFVAVTVLGEPVGSIFLAWMVLDEAPSPIQITGAALILVGVLAASRAEVRAREGEAHDAQSGPRATA